MQPHELSPAVAAFSDFLARVEDGESVDFEEFCARHSRFEPELRKLHAKWSSMANAFEELASGTAQSDGSSSRRESSELLERLGNPARRDDRYADHTEIARGGMGTIVRVWDKELRRSLAMKVLTDAGASSRQVSRFLDEAQVTGQLDHPGIVPVHEIGLDARGRLYYTMPLIKGRDFKEIIGLVHAGDEQWSLHRALGVLVRVAEAMAYAHSKGVLHRDLKPANIMVAPFGETYVMDWGLARVRGTQAIADAVEADPEGSVQTDRREVASDSDDSPLLTSDGDIVGTPAYMPPEQARGDIDRLGVRSDIYAVGAVLYHLLTGRVPYTVPGDRASSHTILKRLLDRAPEPPRTVRPDLPAELAAICERAMARDPDDRFARMMELADNLRAFLEGRVVRAYESGAIAELRKWIVRNRWLALTSAAGLVVLIAGFVVSTSLFFAADAHASRADATAENLESELRASTVDRGRLLSAVGNLGTGERLIWRAHLMGLDRRHSQWALWESYSANPVLNSRRIHDKVVYRIRALPDGTFVSGGGDGRIREWSSEGTGDPTVLGDHGKPVFALAISPDGNLLATGGTDGRIALWDRKRRQQTRVRLAHRGLVHCLVFSPDGGSLLSGGRDGRVCVEDVASGERKVIRRYGHAVTALAWHPSGDRIAAGFSHGKIKIYRPEAPEERLLLHEHTLGVQCILFSPDGTRLYSTATGSEDRTIRIWDAGTGKRLEVLRADNGAARELILTADGKTLFANGWWRIDRWNLQTGQRERSLGIPEPSMGMALRHDEKVMVSGHEDGTIRYWDLAGERAFHRLEGHEGPVSVAISPDGRFAATGDKKGAVRLWDAHTGEFVRAIGTHEGRVKSVVFSPDGSILASGAVDSTLHLWNVHDGSCIATFEDHVSVSSRAIAFDPKGRNIAFSCKSDSKNAWVELRDMESKELLAEFEGESAEFINVRFDPSGEFLATTERSDMVKVWRRTGEIHREIPIPKPWAVLFDSNRRRLIVGNWQKNILVVDIPSGKIERTLPGHGAVVWSLELRPGEPDVLASGSSDGTVRLWDLKTGRNLVVLAGHTGGAIGIGFSGDGRTLAASSADTFAILHDLDYFDRHIAGNLETQIGQHRDATRVEDLRRWASRVMQRPWPRFR